MPFTFSHPAAVLPFMRPLRGRGSVSALVIGSIAPDIPYFLPVDIARASSHSLPALVYFCLPVGAITFLAFHLFLKPALIELAPPCLGARLRTFLPVNRLLPAGRVPWILACLLLGAITHVGWDSFTHFDGPMVLKCPFLQAEAFRLGNISIPFFKVLQHASTMFGLTAITVYLSRVLRVTPSMPVSTFRLKGWERVAWCALVIGAPFCWATRAAYSVYYFIGFDDISFMVMKSVFATLPAFACALFLYCAVWHLRGLWSMHV